MVGRPAERTGASRGVSPSSEPRGRKAAGSPKGRPRQQAVVGSQRRRPGGSQRPADCWQAKTQTVGRGQRPQEQSEGGCVRRASERAAGAERQQSARAFSKRGFCCLCASCANAGCRWPLACSRCTTHALCVPAGLLAASAVQPAICALHSAARRLDLRSLSEHRDQLTS